MGRYVVVSLTIALDIDSNALYAQLEADEAALATQRKRLELEGITKDTPAVVEEEGDGDE